MTAPEWQSRADVERRNELAERSIHHAGGGRGWTGWKATLAIIAVVAAGTLFLNWLGTATVKAPPSGPSPTVVTVSPR